MGAVVCVDFGSTFTKALLVDLDSGRILASAGHPTTIGTDVLDGYDACLRDLGAQHSLTAPPVVLACSSAGGGLRIAVVGNEALVTAEAGHRVALSSGGRVVDVIAMADAPDLDARLSAADPDLVLLTGGTDGGNSEVLLAAADALGAAAWSGPVVVAGNAEATPEVARRLGARPHVIADNVLPRIGELRPGSARAAVREMFLAHVIGGKHLSARPEFAAMVRGATPDVVLTAVELLAQEVGDVVVVDVGGATTDVHSFVELDAEASELGHEVVNTTALTRTVEGDLGMRWSAVDTVGAAAALGVDQPGLRAAALRRAALPSYLPSDEVEQEHDVQLASAAVAVAVRRHAGRARVVLAARHGETQRVVERSGTDLREVALLIGSGGALRAATPEVAQRILKAAVGEDPGGWQLPRAPRLVVDRHYVLAAAGLLATDHPDAARALLRGLAADSA